MPEWRVRQIGRLGDMSPKLALMLTEQGDGDIQLSVGWAPGGMAVAISRKEADMFGGRSEDRYATVEFCTLSGGGGRSPAVRRALVELWKAIEEDNQARPDAAIRVPVSAAK